jgi:hypothetical protein
MIETQSGTQAATQPTVWPTKTGYAVIALIGLVFIAGLAYSHWLGEDLRYIDERDYYAIANNLVESGLFSIDGIQPTIFRPPGYAFVLALAVGLGAGVVGLRVFNFALLAGCMVLVYAQLHRQISPFAGLVGVAMVSCYVVLFYTAGTLFPQTLGALLLLAIVYLLATSTSSHVARYAFIGVLFGLLILTIPAFGAALVATVVWLALARKIWRGVFIVLACTTCVVSGWTLRNYLTFGAFVPVSANSGVMLIAGNSENTTFNSGISTDYLKYFLVADPMPEIERDEYYRSKAIEYVRANPARTLTLYLGKLANYFNFRNELYTKEELSSLNDLIMLMTYYPLLFLAGLRVVYLRKQPATHYEWLLIALYLADALFTAVFFTRIRYRLPLDFLLVLLSASFLAPAITKLRTKRSAKTSSK